MILIEFVLGVLVSLSLWWFMLEIIKRDVVDMLSKSSDHSVQKIKSALSHQICPRIIFFPAVAINKSSDSMIIVFHSVACNSIFHLDCTCNADQMLASFSVTLCSQSSHPSGLYMGVIKM